MWGLVWRYLWRSPRPIVRWLLRLSFVGLLLSAWAWIVVASVFNGFSAFLEEVFSRADPDIRLVGRGLSNSLRTQIESLSEVEAVGGLYERVALLRYGSRQAVVKFRLIDEAYARVTRLGSQMLVGEGFPLRQGAIFIGAGVAARLAFSASEEEPLWIYVVPSGRQVALMGMEALLRRRAIVQGVFSVHKEYDESWVLARQQDWPSLKGVFYDAIEIRLREGVNVSIFLKSLQESLPPFVEAQDIRRQHEGIFRVLSQEKALGRVGLTLLLLLTVSGVISTLSAFLLLGRRDWALYQALGASPKWTRRLVGRMSAALLIGGSGSGLLLGTLTVLIQQEFQVVKLRGGEGLLIQHFPVKLLSEDYLWLFGLLILVGGGLALYAYHHLEKVDLRSALQGD
ncbi:MAG: ABC transporter permease [Bacteroidia bacterium]|nr:ABC transporter permease [Bacteroidia bacterium]MDW8015694.1 ABC transporter permease [Bacteroidia bacterium]